MNAYQEIQAPRRARVPPFDEELQAFFDASFSKEPKPQNASPFSRPIPPWPYQNLHTQPSPTRAAAVVLEENLERQVVEFAKRDALKEVRQHYMLPVDSSVAGFLTTHRSISQILLAAVPQLKTVFGANAVVRLRAPIDESGVRVLYAIVLWPGKLSDVRAALARFDDQWWLPNSPQTNGYLVFTYELV